MQDCPDEWAIVANVASDRALRTGARVWILWVNGDAEHPKVLGLSKSGRLTEKYTTFKRLTNFRARWIPPHLRSRFRMTAASKDAAARYADALCVLWSDVRYFDRDGARMVKDGISAAQALDRARR